MRIVERGGGRLELLDCLRFVAKCPSGLSAPSKQPNDSKRRLLGRVERDLSASSSPLLARTFGTLRS